MASLLIAFGIAACAPSPDAQDYDVVILNGRVMDPETEFDGIRNVGIKDGRIVAITEESISGEQSIDATGHVVAPGFIDTQDRPAGRSHHQHGHRGRLCGNDAGCLV